MSQVSIIDIEGNNPQIPTEFVADIGSAVPIANVLEILGDTVPAGVLPVFTTGSGNTITTNVQISQAIAASNALNVGLAAFNEDDFTVDANGFVSVISGAQGIESVNTNVGGPVTPTGAGAINIFGEAVAPAGAPVKTDGTVANTVRVQVQRTSEQALSSSVNAGLASFNNAHFDVDGNGWVSLLGSALGSFNVDANTPPGTDPVIPNVSGIITVTGGQVAAGTTANVIQTNSLAVNTYTIQIQRSSAQAVSTVGANGVSHFDSSTFAVDANGFVSASTTGIGKTITGDSGGALSPIANNWNILGGPGVTTSGSGNTLTVNSVVFTDTTAITLLVDNGYFATAAGTYAMPATAAQGEMIIVVCDTTGAVVLDCPANNFIRIGNLITSSGGTVTSTLQGDSLTMRYRLSSLTWEATSVIGTWLVA